MDYILSSPEYRTKMNDNYFDLLNDGQFGNLLKNNQWMHQEK